MAGFVAGTAPEHSGYHLCQALRSIAVSVLRLLHQIPRST